IVQYLFEHQEVYICYAIGILLGHIIYKEGLLVDPAKVAVIISLKEPTSQSE
ncbi:hypothetical protein KI387_033684, partial [Taxus chinensis]